MTRFRNHAEEIDAAVAALRGSAVIDLDAARRRRAEAEARQLSGLSSEDAQAILSRLALLLDRPPVAPEEPDWGGGPPGAFLGWLLLAAVVLLLAAGGWLLWGALAGPAEAHLAPAGWTYDAVCCAGHDCAQAVPGTVVEDAAGIHVTVRPGTHPMWPASRLTDWTGSLPHGDTRIRQSRDEHYHVCLGAAGQLLCLYVPPRLG